MQAKKRKIYIYGDITVQCKDKDKCQHVARFVENKK